jgi:hypothetical protein
LTVKQGDALKVGVPVNISFTQLYRVSEGYPKTATLEVWHDERTATAPIHPTTAVKSFAKLEADLSQVPNSEMNKLVKRFPDGNNYYAVACAVEATFNSASMKYVLLVGGIRYDVVTVDYS